MARQSASKWRAALLASRIFLSPVTLPTSPLPAGNHECPVIIGVKVLERIEICGLLGTNNGRSCVIHDRCGDQVLAGHILRLKRCVVEMNGLMEMAYKVVSITNMCENCTVGFIPRSLIQVAESSGLHDKFVSVVEMYADSDNRTKRRKSHTNKGMAKCVLLDVNRQIYLHAKIQSLE